VNGFEKNYEHQERRETAGVESNVIWGPELEGETRLLK